MLGCGGCAEYTGPGVQHGPGGTPILIALGSIPTQLRAQPSDYVPLPRANTYTCYPLMHYLLFPPDLARPLKLFYCSRLEYPELGGIYPQSLH